MTIAYWAVVLLGAVTLIIEAHRQFSVSVDVHPHERYPILQGVSLDALCTTGELIRGFLLYVSLYLGAYAVILGSAEVYSIVVQSTGQDEKTMADGFDIVGARDTNADISDVGEPATAFDLGKPIFVSATIIAALSIGLFSPIERIMRGYAHWIAAIPRGVYRVISGLKRADYEGIGGKRFQGPLAKDFAAFINTLDLDQIDNNQIREIQNSLSAIDVLKPAVLGKERDQLFSAFMPPAIETLVAKLDEEYSSFRDHMKAIQPETNDLRDLSYNSATLCNNMQALFALLYIRNQKAAVLVRTNTPSTRIVGFLRTDREPNYHAVTGAVFFMALSILILHPLAYFLTIKNAPFEAVKAFVRNETIVAIILSTLMFSLCSAVALLTREASNEYGRWPEWKIRQVPFLRFFQHAIFPGIVAVLLCALVKSVEFFLTVETVGGFDVFLQTNWQFCLMNFFFGFSIAGIVFCLVDQHKYLNKYKTVFLGLVATAPYLVWVIFVQSLDDNPTSLPNVVWMTREVFLMSVAPLSFTVMFAFLLEMSEE